MLAPKRSGTTFGNFVICSNYFGPSQPSQTDCPQDIPSRTQLRWKMDSTGRKGTVCRCLHIPFRPTSSGEARLVSKFNAQGQLPCTKYCVAKQSPNCTQRPSSPTGRCLSLAGRPMLHCMHSGVQHQRAPDPWSSAELGLEFDKAKRGGAPTQ